MAQATQQLNATEQDTLVKQIGLALLRGAPRDWRSMTASYRAVGRYHELDGEIFLSDGSSIEWVATHDIATLFGRLRAGMYRDERGTWFNGHYKLEAPASYNLEYDREEPEWHLHPPAQAYADELRMFPRAEENVPEWLMRRLAGLSPERPGPRFRIARVFDGTGPTGKPVINRPDLDMEEQDRLLDYLGDAPIVLPGKGYDLDRLAAAPEPRVPVGFHSDGSWIWPAAVNYYLREYGVSPEGDLVAHIKANSYTVPRVSDEQLAAANGYLTRGDAAPPPTAPGPPAMPRTQFAPPTPPPATQREQNGPEPAAEHVARHSAGPEQGEDGDLLERTQHSTPADLFNLAEETGPGDLLEPTQGAIPPVPLPSSGSYEPEEDYDDEYGSYEPPRHDGNNGTNGVGFAPGAYGGPGPRDAGEPAVEELLDKLDELGVDPSEYRIGEPARNGWSLERVPEGWRVGWYDDELTEPEVFGNAEDASAYLLGKVLLAPRGRRAAVPPPVPREDLSAQFYDTPEGDEPDAHERAPAAWERHPEPDVAQDAGEHEPEPEPEPERGYAEELGQPERGYAEELGQPSSVAATLTPRTKEPDPSANNLHLPPPVSPPPSVYTPPAQPTRSEAPVGTGAPAQPSAGQQWPIQPLPGEPPLTLFRGKELREVPAGTELDRFGTSEGNLTYVAGTPFEERSLVPEWVSRPYHVYRVQRPIEAVAGVAIPWFNQPGGGSACLLPVSVEELLADGVLIELDPGDPPID